MSLDPRFAASVVDSVLVADEPANDSGMILGELLVRRWLYSLRTCPAQISDAITRATEWQRPGTGDVFRAAYEKELLPRRRTNIADNLSVPVGLDAMEQRVWGYVVSRITSYLKADGVIVLVPPECDDAVAVPFRFVESPQPSCSMEADGPHDAWTKLLRRLRDGKIIDGDHSVVIDASFSPAPSGDSLGLALALAWLRWKAKRGMPFYSALDVVATGEINFGEGRAVKGTGGEFQDDLTGGAKGKLAERIGAKVFVTFDVAHDFQPKGMQVVRCTSSDRWKDIRGACAQAIGRAIKSDSPAYLFRVDAEEEHVVAETDQTITWSRIRRLSRLSRYYAATDRVDDDKRVRARIERLAFGLGFRKRFVRRGFETVEKRHQHHYGRNRELDQMDSWLHGPKRALLITGPVGRGKSGLLTEWNRRLLVGDRISIFFHYISQNDNTNGTALLYRRLIEHLYWEIEEVPPDDNAADAESQLSALDLAWSAWEGTKSKRPLLLIVDGLDEATEDIGPLVPDGERIPEDVWVVASCRSGDGRQFPIIQKWAEKIGPELFDSWELPPIDDPSLATWIKKEIGEGLPFEDRAFLVRRLQEITSGMTLFIRHVLADVKEAIAEQRDWNKVLYETPQDFIKYLRIQWKSLDTLVSKQSDAHAEIGREMVLTLVAGRGPFTIREFKRLFKKDAGFEEPYLPALRWMDIQPSDDAWGEIYTLNHESIRYALKDRVGAEHRERIRTFCEAAWRDGSPHALRHLPEYLVEIEQWEALDSLVTDRAFLNLQRTAFPNEPGLALGVVRSALEEATTRLVTNPVALTELSLTHAKLVRILTRATVDDDGSPQAVDTDALLARATEIANLPVEWDPASTRMWQLVAAWLCHQKGRKDERDEFLRTFGRTPQKVPYQWIHIATDLLPGCFDHLGGSWLTELAWRCLPIDAFPNFVARIAERNSEGRRMALTLIEARSENDESLLPEETRHGRACRRELLTAWAEFGDWDSACAYALEPLREGFLDHAADRIRHVGNLAKAAARAAVLDRLTEALLAAERVHPWHASQSREINAPDEAQGKPKQTATPLEPSTLQRPSIAPQVEETGAEDVSAKVQAPLKIWEILGQLCAWQIGSLIKGGRDSLEYKSNVESQISSLESQAKEFRWRLKVRRQPGAVTIAYELAEAFSEQAHFSWGGRVASFQTRSAVHWEQAVELWQHFKGWRNAHTLEVFQQAMWLAHSTLLLTKRNIWPPKESAKKRDAWFIAIRDVLHLGDDSRRLAEMLQIPKTGQLRWMEPLEWNAAIVAAIEVLVQVDGVTPAEMAHTICRARSATERGRAVFRCLAAWAEQYSPERADQMVEELFASHEWDQVDISTGWALWFRLTRRKGRPNFLSFAVRTIEEGTAKTGMPKSVYRAELAVEVAARHPVSERAELLFRFANDTVSKRSAKVAASHAMLLWSDLAKAAAILPSNTTWRARFVGEALNLADRALNTPALSLSVKIQTIINYAALAAEFDDKHRAANALRDATEIARSINTLTRRVAALCDIAEINAKCSFVEQAGIKLREAADLIPGRDGGQLLGTKPDMLRPHLAARWLLGTAKALAHQAPPTGNMVPLQHWSDCVLDPRRFLMDWDVTSRPGKSLLDIMSRDDFDDFHRARAIAGAWRALFDRSARNKGELWQIVTDSLAAIGGPATWARAQRDLAMIEARADRVDQGRGRYALRRARRLSTSFNKEDVLHRVGSVFAKNYIEEQGRPDPARHRRAFLTTVPDCAESFSSTFLMLANVVRLFPEHTRKIDEVLERRRIFS